MAVTVYSNDTSLNWSATGDERLFQNVRNILRTKMFEVPFMRYLGINQDFIDSNHPYIKAEFATHISEVITANEPRVSVQDVRIEYDANGDCVIAVDLEV